MTYFIIIINYQLSLRILKAFDVNDKRSLTNKKNILFSVSRPTRATLIFFTHNTTLSAGLSLEPVLTGHTVGTLLAIILGRESFMYNQGYDVKTVRMR